MYFNCFNFLSTHPVIKLGLLEMIKSANNVLGMPRMIQFPSWDAFDAANKANNRKGRLYRLDRVMQL